MSNHLLHVRYKTDSDHRTAHGVIQEGTPTAQVHTLGAGKDGPIEPMRDDKDYVPIADPAEDICHDLYVLSTDYKPVNEVAQLRVDSLSILEPCKDELHNLSTGYLGGNRARPLHKTR